MNSNNYITYLPPPAKATPLLTKKGIKGWFLHSKYLDSPGLISTARKRIFKIIIIFILLFGYNAFAQTDWVKWGKADYSYQVKNPAESRKYTFDLSNPGRFVLKSLVNGYWFFISDVDGDNCSFSPTCSGFFVQSVEKTNIVQGSLMFFDRFTRDMDIFGKLNHYPRVPDGHFYDPPSLYSMRSDSIKYIPPSTVVKY